MPATKPMTRAYALLVSRGVRTMDEVVERYKVPVYVELINNYGWTIDQVDEAYKEQVKTELEKQ